MKTSTSFARCVPALPPPGEWPELECPGCGGRDRRPFHSEDGLCASCRRAREEEAVEEGRRAIRRELALHLGVAGVPVLYAGSSRAAWEAKHGRWADDPGLRKLVGWPGAGGGLLVVYGHGERSTRLATAVLGEALCRGLTCVFRDASEWLRELRNGFDSDASSQRAWERLAEAAVAVLAGLGTRGEMRAMSPWSRGELADLIEYRRVRRRPTILTSRASSWRALAELHPRLEGLEEALKLKTE